MINGLALLPVLLSLIGPPSEIVPNGGGTTLECPQGGGGGGAKRDDECRAGSAKQRKEQRGKGVVAIAHRLKCRL